MKKYSIPRNIWRAIYPLLIFFGIQIIVSFAVVIIYTVNLIINNGMDAIAALDEMQMAQQVANISQIMSMISSIVCLAPFLPIWLKTKKNLNPYETKNPIPLLFVSFFVFASFSIVLGFLIDITAIVRFFPSYEELMKYMVGDNLIIYLISVVILAPIIEELCLRGIIFNRLESWMRTWLAVLIQAALFGIAHMNLFQGLYAFIGGVALGWLYIRFRKLWLCIIGHMGFNFVSFIIILLERKGVEISNWTLIPIAVVFIVGIYFLFKIPAAKEKYTPSADGDIFAEEG